MNSKLNAPHLQSEEAAREAMERIRWPNGPVCHHCGSSKHYGTKKAGRYRCANPECRKDFTVMTGSVMGGPISRCISGSRLTTCFAHPRRDAAPSRSNAPL